MILGVTGTDGSGKGTVVDYLVHDKGFAHYHGRKLFIEKIEEQGLENNRANMRLVANAIRKEHGNDAIVVLFLQQAREKGDANIIIDSIRALAEAQTLKKEGGILIAVDADPKIRYQRIQERNSSSDNVTFEEFIKHEQLEMNDPDPHGMQKQKVIEAADFTIQNNGTLQELHDQVDAVLKLLS